MYHATKIKKQIEESREKINSLTAEGEIKLTHEILKLSEELDILINIWSQTYYRKTDNPEEQRYRIQ